MPPRVLHLAGSPTSAFFAELSRLYARDCLAETTDPALQEPIIAWVTPDGCWRLPDSLEDDAIAAAAPMSAIDAIAHLQGATIDVVLPQMFCLAGMTAYRALWELLAIPYVGNRPATMAICADKAQAKAIVAGAGVATPASQVVTPGEPVTLELPVVVKPVDADNSAGITLVREADALDAAIAGAREHSTRVLVETYVELGREVRCGIVEEEDGTLRCLPLEEYAVDAAHKPIRDAGDKLARSAGGDLTLVAKERSRAWIVDREDPVCGAVWAAAKRAHEALGCRHYSLFDFRIDPDGRPWFLEAGPYCSYARGSVLCAMARAEGVSAAELLAGALRTATTASPSTVGSLR